MTGIRWCKCFFSSNDFFDVTKYGMFLGWILGVIIWYTNILVIWSNVEFILGSTDVEVLESDARVPDGFMVDIYESK